jgi:hypothetical protein
MNRPMKSTTHILLLGLISVIAFNPKPAQAVDWTKVTENAAGDQFFVDTSAIQRKGSTAFYWEYREFSEPNDAFLEIDLPQPLYGAVSRWSVECGSKAQRLNKVNAYTKNRALIQKYSYGDKGLAVQSRPGSSSYKVIEFVCSYKAKS